MKRPVMVTVIILSQLLLAILLAGLAAYCLWLTRSQEILSESDAADAVHGLMIGAAALGVPALVLFVSCWGLWKSKLWGWWLALAGDVTMLAVFAYGTFDTNSIEWDEVRITLCLLILLVFLLLPKVRKFYWTGHVPQVEVSS